MWGVPVGRADLILRQARNHPTLRVRLHMFRVRRTACCWTSVDHGARVGHRTSLVMDNGVRV